MWTLQIDSLSSPCDLSSYFDEAETLNARLAEQGRRLVSQIFPFDKAARLLESPREDAALAPSDIYEQWCGAIVPINHIDYHINAIPVCDPTGYKSRPAPERPGVYSPSPFAITALGLYFIQSIREWKISFERLEKIYEAFVFWKHFNLWHGSVSLEFRPKGNNEIAMGQFAEVMQVVH